MRKQWIPGSLFPAHREPGYEANDKRTKQEANIAPSSLQYQHMNEGAVEVFC